MRSNLLWRQVISLTVKCKSEISSSAKGRQASSQNVLVVDRVNHDWRRRCGFNTKWFYESRYDHLCEESRSGWWSCKVSLNHSRIYSKNETKKFKPEPGKQKQNSKKITALCSGKTYQPHNLSKADQSMSSLNSVSRYFTTGQSTNQEWNKSSW